MKIQGVQCDTCADLSIAAIPDDWLTLTRGSEELHFCCIKHLRNWVEKQVEVKGQEEAT